MYNSLRENGFNELGGNLWLDNILVSKYLLLGFKVTTRIGLAEYSTQCLAFNDPLAM